MNEYIAFMISRETENVHSAKEVEDAFRAITEGGAKPFVTEEELYQVFRIFCVIYCFIQTNRFNSRRAKETLKPYGNNTQANDWANSNNSRHRSELLALTQTYCILKTMPFCQREGFRGLIDTASKTLM